MTKNKEKKLAKGDNMAEKIFLEIDAKTAQAAKNLTKFGRTATKTMEGIQSSLSGVKLLAGGVVGFLAGRKIIQGLEKITKAASVQEDAINSVNTAMKTSGEFTEAASIRMQEYASQIQQTSIYGDELILNQLALAKAFGASNEQAEKIVTAATELAAATGKSLDEATRQVSKTLGGFAGELGEVNPAIKALTAEQLQAGQAAEILIKQYSGSALSKINTYSGAVQQLTNVQGDLLEELGFLITRNPIVIEGVKKLTDFFGEMIKVVQANQEGIGELVSKGFKKMISAVPALLKSLKFVSDAYDGIKLAIDLSLQAFIDMALFAAKAANLATWNPLEALQETLTGKELPNKTRDMVRELEALKKASEDSFGDNIGANAFTKTLDEAIKKAESLTDEINKIPDKTINVNVNTQVNGTDKAVAEVKKDIEGMFDLNFGVSGPGITPDKTAPGFTQEGPKQASFWENAAATMSQAFDTQMEKMNVGSTIADGFSAALSGKQGAQKLIAAGVEAAGMMAGIPGLGQIADQLMTLGPEGAKQMVIGFAEALPDLIIILVEALTEAAPAFMERMVEVLLIEGGLERIVVALLQAVPRIAYKMSEAMVRNLNSGFVAISERFGLNLTRTFQIPGWVEDLKRYVNGLTKTPDWMSKFQLSTPAWMTRLEELFNWLPNAIRKATGQGGGGSTIGGTTGAVANKIKSLYSSKGGVVYAADGFVPRGTDTVPAMLTPGERVLSVSQNASFEAMPVLLAQILQVLGQPMTTSTSIEIDGNKLADVILQLNRQNQRLTA